MKLYNTLSQSLETFSSPQPTATIYVCGVTPYDTTHLGHVFTYAAFDVLIRYLEFQGYQVHYVQNVTDIDDDILRKAKEVGEDWQSLGNRWTAHFIRDMQMLNIRPPDHFPGATEVISGIIAAVQKLLTAGLAYESGGSVYFHIEAWPKYGELSHLPPDQMLPIANERGNNPADPHKRDPLDFVLWQAQAPGEPAWDSPWGPGRPGWHIECSTMSTSLLGPTLDIHGGGADLVFPHHESEIAQAEGATGQVPFVRFWLHTAMVQYEGEKMSKSLGNLVMARDLLKLYSPDALRLYLSRYHYRESWSYDPQVLAAAARSADTWRAAVTATGGEAEALEPAPAWLAFTEAMDNDVATPAALAAAEELVGQTLQAAQAGRDVQAAQETLRDMGHILGLRLEAEAPEARVIAGWREHLKRFEDLTPQSA